MRKRTLSREFALQVLYQIDVTGESPDEALEKFWKCREEDGIEEQVSCFAGELVKGAFSRMPDIDGIISRHATNWQLKRMAIVDRNILRLGCYELAFRTDIPPKVSINEAVELAKRYSSIEAGKFVNAVLDKIKAEQKK